MSNLLRSVLNDAPGATPCTMAQQRNDASLRGEVFGELRRDTSPAAFPIYPILTPSAYGPVRTTSWTEAGMIQPWVH